MTDIEKRTHHHQNDINMAKGPTPLSCIYSNKQPLWSHIQHKNKTGKKKILRGPLHQCNGLKEINELEKGI